MQRISEEPQGGLKEFYKKYGRLITSTARLFCKDTFLANAVVGEVLEKIWKGCGTFGEIANPKGWIYVITSNCAKSLLRQRRCVPLKETIADKKDGIQEFIDKDSFYFMIKDLSEVEQQIIIHKCISEFTFEEIGETLDKPTSTVSSIYYRSIEKIKEKIKNFQENA